MEESILTKLEESLECPVCYNIPRELPISCCEAGHILCKSCKNKLFKCPTCRRSIKSSNITNNLAETQIMLINHKCKFSFYGCKVKMKINEIILHEKNCTEKTIKCPRSKCREDIQIKKFYDHTLKKGCGESIIQQSDTEAYNFYYNIYNFNKNKNMQTMKMVNLYFHNQCFYFIISYIASTKCFMITVMLPDSNHRASQYKVKITIISQEQRKLIYEGNVVSIDKLYNIDNKIENLGVWIIPYNALEPLINREIKYIFSIPFEVKVQ